MIAYWVNWIYVDCHGKTRYGAWNECEISLERAVKGVEWLKKHTENLVAAWVVRSEEQPDGSRKNTGAPYLEVFVDAFGCPPIQAQKVTDERGEPKKPILRNSDEFCCELNVCPTCGHIVEGVESMENFKFCPGCGQRIDWEGALKDALGE